MTFGGQTLTLITVTETGPRDRYNNPSKVRTEVSVSGCRFRPVTFTEDIDTGDRTTERWRLTAPPAAQAARAGDEIRVDGITYQVVDGAQVFTDMEGEPFKVTVICERIHWDRCDCPSCLDQRCHPLVGRLNSTQQLTGDGLHCGPIAFQFGVPPWIAGQGDLKLVVGVIVRRNHGQRIKVWLQYLSIADAGPHRRPEVVVECVAVFVNAVAGAVAPTSKPISPRSCESDEGVVRLGASELGHAVTHENWRDRNTE
jgi:hypothetical protein